MENISMAIMKSINNSDYVKYWVCYGGKTLNHDIE